MRKQQGSKSLSALGFAALSAARNVLALGRAFLLYEDVDEDERDRRNREMDARDLELTLREASLDLRRALWGVIQGNQQARGGSGWPNDPLNTEEGRRALTQRLFLKEMSMRNMDPSPFRVSMHGRWHGDGTTTGRYSSVTGKFSGPWWQHVEIVERSAIDRLGGLVDA